MVVLSDNGASSEGGPIGSLNDARVWNALPRTVEEAAERLDEIGGPRIHNNYPWGWTVAGNTPFRRWKRETHEGGVADPLIVHWPAGIAARRRGPAPVRARHRPAPDDPRRRSASSRRPRSAGVAQRPLDGVSFRSTFDDAAAPEVRTVQHYEMLGCRALYQDGWKAVTYQEIQVDEPRLDEAVWELYDLRADPSECHDLADAEPERLAAHDRAVVGRRRSATRCCRSTTGRSPSSCSSARRRWRHAPATRTGPAARRCPRAWPSTCARAPTTSPPTSRCRDGLDVLEGVLAVQGSVLGGWSFHLLADGRLCYVHNLAGWREYRVEADIGRLAPGDHTLAFRFRPPAAELLVDGEVVGAGEVKRTVWSRFSLTGAGLTAGWSPDFSPADRDYRGRFEFTGVLHRVDVDVEGLPVVDAGAGGGGRSSPRSD